MKFWKIWIGISLLVLVPGLVSLGVFGLKLGIDFAGGTLIERTFTGTAVSIDEIKQVFSDHGVSGAIISQTGETGFIARSHSIEPAKYNEIVASLNEKVGESREERYETVGPTVSRDLATKAIMAVVVASIAIVLYIAWAFRTVPKPLSSWKFGLSAIIALLHDLVIVIGIFSLFGHYFGVEIDSLFITALLTIMGFSVHDTIVVFDRIRENSRTAGGTITQVANKSISETMARSINTSATVLFALLALLLFGGSSIYWFVMALVIGIVAGTYSSIFVASVLVVRWHKG